MVVKKEDKKPVVKKAPVIKKAVIEKAEKIEKVVAIKKAATLTDGKYIGKIGKRKRATASVRLIKGGKGTIIVNGQPAEKYFSVSQINSMTAPLRLVEELNYDFSIMVMGGGKVGQADAIRHGITKALLEIDPEWRSSLKAQGFVTRDARKKERKKPGLRRARRAPQWSKR